MSTEKFIIQPGNEGWDKPDEIAKKVNKKLYKKIQKANSPTRNNKSKQTQKIDTIPKIVDLDGAELNSSKPSPRIIMPNDNVPDKDTKIFSANGNKSKENRPPKIYTSSGQQRYTGPIIETVDSAELPSGIIDSNSEGDLKYWHQKIGISREDFYSYKNKDPLDIIDKVLKHLSNLYPYHLDKTKIDNFLSLKKYQEYINYRDDHNNPTKLRDLNQFVFSINRKEQKNIIKELLFFYKTFEPEIAVNELVKVAFFEAIFLLNKYAIISEQDNNKKYNINSQEFINGELMDLIINQFQLEISKKNIFYLQALIKSQIEKLTDSQAQEVLNIFARNNNLNNDKLFY